MGDLAERLDELRHTDALAYMRGRLEVIDGVEQGQPLPTVHENYMEILEESAQLAVGAWRVARLSIPHPVVRMDGGETHA